MTPAYAKPDILVIDDEVQIRRLLQLTLESAGYRVRDPENGPPGPFISTLAIVQTNGPGGPFSTKAT